MRIDSVVLFLVTFCLFIVSARREDTPTEKALKQHQVYLAKQDVDEQNHLLQERQAMPPNVRMEVEIVAFMDSIREDGILGRKNISTWEPCEGVVMTWNATSEQFTITELDLWGRAKNIWNARAGSGTWSSQIFRKHYSLTVRTMVITPHELNVEQQDRSQQRYVNLLEHIYAALQQSGVLATHTS